MTIKCIKQAKRNLPQPALSSVTLVRTLPVWISEKAQYCRIKVIRVRAVKQFNGKKLDHSVIKVQGLSVISSTHLILRGAEQVVSSSMKRETSDACLVSTHHLHTVAPGDRPHTDGGVWRGGEDHRLEEKRRQASEEQQIKGTIVFVIIPLKFFRSFGCKFACRISEDKLPEMGGK